MSAYSCETACVASFQYQLGFLGIAERLLDGLVAKVRQASHGVLIPAGWFH